MISPVIMIHKSDNVVTTIKQLKPGNNFKLKPYNDFGEITVKDIISFGHKCAIKKIPKGGKVIKYGEVIGIATRDILCGEHVHVHNLKSIRGRKI